MAALGTTNISTTLVRNTLGEDNNDVGLLCTSDKINRFSKYKPILHTDPHYNLVLSGSPDNSWWGLTIPTLDQMNSYGNWTYDKPPSSYPKRLGDFRMYYHEAPIALIQQVGNKMDVTPFFGLDYTVWFAIVPFPTGMENYCLNVSNITPSGGGNVLLDNYYLGAALYSTSGHLVAEYYATKKIKYSSGPSADLEGSSIPLVGPRIEDVPKGTYTLCLFITDDNTIQQVGEPTVFRNFWPVYWNTSYPKNIPLEVFGLEGVYEAAVLGIRPGGGIWNNSDTDWKVGYISKSAVGFLTDFDVKIRLYNVAGRKTYIPYNKIYLFWNRLTDWSGSTSEQHKVLSISASSIVLENNGNVDLTFSGVLIAPSTPPSVNVNIDHEPAFGIYYGNGVGKEEFVNPLHNVVSLEYNSF